ncbi:mediator of RNA polymerase II transcription subunit 15a-like isoform X2 [Lycium ferocissimum]|uniref:mediator of RNA polymerase II transcription subunit 15a-like isoform X2 n=1 Tax=Lycium ferocissimum TaxID=112874 RepID=UPI002816550D|nr:mediator of RNA polymerase II transcription subunit 15a-like isoform X2 [Lycium ferocissimum]
MDSGDWRTPQSRQRIVNNIMETLYGRLPISGEEEVEECKKIAVRFEEEIYTAATNQQDYLRKLSLKMLPMDTTQNPITNSLHPNASSSGPNAHGQASLDSTAQMGNANAADWQEEVYQKIKSMREMYLSELNDLYEKIASKIQQRPQHEHIEKLKTFKMTLERIVLFLRLNKHDIYPIHKEKLLSVEKHISFFLSSNRPHRPASSPLQVQGQLPQPSMHTSQAQNTYAGQTSMMGSGQQDIASEFDRLLSLVD